MKILLANQVDPDQMPHIVASDQGPALFAYDHFPGKNGLNERISFLRSKFFLSG